MKIGLVCHANFGGSGVIATELGLALAARGHEVHFVSSGVPPRLVAAPNVTLHEVIAPAHPLFPHGEFTVALASRLVALAPRLDVLHVHYAIPLAMSAVLARHAVGATAPKLVTTVHGTDVLTLGAQPAFAPMVRHALRESDLVTAPSEFLAGRAKELAGVEVAHVPNFVDASRFVPSAAKPGRVLLHNSNFREIKRVRDSVEIFRRVKGASLVLLGDGPERAAVEALAVPGVELVGEQKNVVPYLHRARALLMPSEMESFGLAALEAMACGVPVIASKVGGLPEVVEDGVTGFLHAVGDVEAMAESARRLLDDDALHARMSAAARERALAHFQITPIVERWEAAYARLLKK